jgi:hypothetical protein
VPVIIEASGSELESPFFKRNKESEALYSSFASHINGEISGTVNGFQFEAVITGTLDGNRFTIDVQRQLQNVQSGFVPKTSPYYEATRIEFETVKPQLNTWKVRPRSFGTACASVLQQVTPVRFNHNLVFISKQKPSNAQLIFREECLKQMMPFGAQQITRSSQKLSVHLHRLCSSETELDTIVRLLSVIIQNKAL